MKTRIYLELSASPEAVRRELIDRDAAHITTTQHIREHWERLKAGEYGERSASDPFYGYREYGQCAQTASTFYVAKAVLLGVDHEPLPRGDDFGA